MRIRYWTFIIFFVITGVSVATEEELIRKAPIGLEKREVVLKRQFVYGLTLFDGGQYLGSFCPEEVETIYMVADMVNVVRARETDVYFWPITREYMADWMTVNKKVPGTLEIIQNGRVVKTQTPEEYVICFPEGFSGKGRKVEVGKVARTVAKDYQEKLARYQEELLQYYQGQLGQKPVFTEGYVTDVDEGFIIKLPAGCYELRLRNEKGEIIPESRKKLVVFPTIEEGVGYIAIMEGKEISPMKSDDLSESIYIHESIYKTIYLEPHKTRKYNSKYYLKLSMLSVPDSGRGMENQSAWVYTNPFLGEGNVLEVLENNRVVERINEELFVIMTGILNDHEFNIRQFSEDEDTFTDDKMYFTGFRVTIPKKKGKYHIRLASQDGKIIPGSLRRIQVVRHTDLKLLLTMALILPSLLFIGVKGKRYFDGKRHIKRSD